jgi:hypothetical protein
MWVAENALFVDESSEDSEMSLCWSVHQIPNFGQNQSIVDDTALATVTPMTSFVYWLSASLSS